MDSLKKLFPLSWKYVKSLKNIILGIVLYLIIGALAGIVIGFAGVLTGWIPVVGALIGWVLRIASILVELYVVAGILLQILVQCKVIK